MHAAISIQALIIVLEWLGTFFLAIEAIKLHNLTGIRDKLRWMSWISLGPLLWATFKQPRALLDKEVLGALGQLIFSGVLLFTLIARILGIEPGVPLGERLGIEPLGLTQQVLLVSVVLLLTLLSTFVLGGLFYQGLFIAVGVVVFCITVIERNTASGIMGISGFLLFSVAAIMKLSGFH